jgi:copper chaperone CopZ
VRVAVTELAGVSRVVYDPDGDVFTVEYDPARGELTDIFAAVFQAGRKMGQDYLPKLIP